MQSGISQRKEDVYKRQHLIREVYPDSIAEAMEIEPGDVLLRINNQKIEDVFDYRYMIKDEYVDCLLYTSWDKQ